MPSWLEFLGTEQAKNVCTVVATVIGSAVALYFAIRTGRHDEQKKRLDAEHAKQRAKLAFNVSITPTAYRAGNYLVINTLVRVVNKSTATWAITAGYVRYRASVDAAEPSRTGPPVRFEKAPVCEGIAESWNAAYKPSTIEFLCPEEHTEFTRHECVPLSFADRYPSLRVFVEIYGAPYDLLGHEKTDTNRQGEIRREWIAIMDAVEQSDEPFPIYERRGTKGAPWKGVDPNARCIWSRQEGTVQPDRALSEAFQQVLDGTDRCTAYGVIRLAGTEPLSPPPAALPADERCLHEPECLETTGRGCE